MKDSTLLEKLPYPKFLLLSPLLLFILLFLGTGIYFGDFYSFPSPVAALVAIVYAMILYPGSYNKKLTTLMEGIGDSKILTMCLIYLLAGAFSVSSSAVGSLDALVDLSISLVSPQWIYVGVFLISAFLSFSSGTSVGAIAALGGVIIGFSSQIGANSSILGAALLCGAMFGDNLSVLSDTTIAATQTMGCSMQDKFKENLKLALPAAFLALIFFYFLGNDLTPLPTEPEFHWESFIKIMPYLVVLGLAISGIHVFIALLAGILAAGALGFVYMDFSILQWSKDIYEGFGSMGEIFYLSLLIGGLAHLVSSNGGILYLIKLLDRFINKRSIYLIISLLVSVVDIAVANNTVSILVVGPLVKKLQYSFKLSAKTIASLLDIFACIFQGVLPYGAQILLIMGLSKNIDYFTLIGNAWYLLFLAISAIIYVFILSIKKNSLT